MPGVEDGIPYKAEDLERFAYELFIRCGVTENDAKLTANSLIVANLRGVDTHGVTRVLVPYVRRLQAGVTSPHTNIRTVRETMSTALIDGGNSIGQVVAAQAMKIAIEKARQTGCAWVGAQHSNHFGTAAYYAMMALEHDYIGVVMTNGIASVAPSGGLAPMLSTNPLAFAVPAGNQPPVVVDMATTVVARGRIMLYAKQGLPIPEGWALDERGRPTTDAHAALRGTLLPMGGYKGYGLSLIVDILAGVMTGSLFGTHFHGPLAEDFTNPMDVGHVFAVLNPGCFVPLDEFKRRMDQALRELRDCPPAEGSHGVLIPGDIERTETERRARAGIPLPAPLIQEFEDLAVELGVPFPEPLSH
ncbi:MAG: Ldh family oxidoreductase [Chloroflexi bacterium]|nr:Ldh family oxidoreductase [Chloroflexota bacterium]